jgi:cell division protein FtsQ
MVSKLNSRPSRRNRSVSGVTQEKQTTRSVRTARNRAARAASGSGLGSSGRQPPVLVRRGTQDMAMPLRRSKPPRRRYDLTLSVPGAEVRLPSLPNVSFSWRIASLVLVVWMALAAYALLFSSAFQVEVLEVEGLKRLTLDDLSLAVGITGEPVVSLNPGEIRQILLKAFPDLADVQVQVGLPASVRIVLIERQPVIAWVRGEDITWVDADGVVFPKRGEADVDLLWVKADSLPTLTSQQQAEMNPAFEILGLGGPIQQIDPQLVEVLFKMSEFRPPESGEMVFDDQRGFGWTDPRGWQVYFGTRLDDIDQKLVVYDAIVERMVRDGIQPALISVEFLHAPYYRMEH